jgi:hypothetical protein
MKIHSGRIVASLLLLASATAASQTLENADFEAASGSWISGEGPPAWNLNLGHSGQVGLVETLSFVEGGDRAFRFNLVERGFGSARLEQCIELGDALALQLSSWVWVEEPHPELAVRLRMDFYADNDCQTDSAAANDEQIQTDISLSGERVPAKEWVSIQSAVRLASELGEDVRSVRISLRQRDRSDNGYPRNPARNVWFDRVSTAADVRFLPASQRAALRELYLASDGPNWPNALGWMDAEGTECQWQGVQCSSTGDQLLRLSLPRNRLLGELPESLAELTDLLPGEGLDLCWNDVLVPSSLQSFIDQHHLGGDPGHCQGLTPSAFTPDCPAATFRPMLATAKASCCTCSVPALPC